jgi:hypothetical protein
MASWSIFFSSFALPLLVVAESCSGPTGCSVFCLSCLLWLDRAACLLGCAYGLLVWSHVRVFSSILFTYACSPCFVRVRSLGVVWECPSVLGICLVGFVGLPGAPTCDFISFDVVDFPLFRELIPCSWLPVSAASQFFYASPRHSGSNHFGGGDFLANYFGDLLSLLFKLVLLENGFDTRCFALLSSPLVIFFWKSAELNSSYCSRTVFTRTKHHRCPIPEPIA